MHDHPPPCTLPAMLASPMPIQRLGTGSTRRALSKLPAPGSVGGNRPQARRRSGMPGLASRMSTVIKAKVSRRCSIGRGTRPRPSTTATRSRWSCFKSVKKGIADVVTSKKRYKKDAVHSSSSRWSSSTPRRARRSRRAARTSRGWRSSARRSRRPSCSRSTPRSRARGSAGASSPRDELEAAPEDRAVPDQKEVIKAQYSAAEAQVKVSRPPTGSASRWRIWGSRSSARDKTETMRARASAVELEKTQARSTT